MKNQIKHLIAELNTIEINLGVHTTANDLDEDAEEMLDEARSLIDAAVSQLETVVEII